MNYTDWAWPDRKQDDESRKNQCEIAVGRGSHQSEQSSYDCQTVPFFFAVRLLLEEGEALTWEQVNHETLQEAAAKAAKHVDVDYDQVLEMEAPKETEGRIWLTVLERCREL